MPEETRYKMDMHFGGNVSKVRMFEGYEAPQVNAKAFAQGNEIHFAPGQFRPGTPQGDFVIAHELEHVVQQNEKTVPATGVVEGFPVNSDPSLEDAASRSANSLGTAPTGKSRVIGSVGANGPVQRMITLHEYVEPEYKKRKAQPGKVVSPKEINSISKSVYQFRSRVLEEMAQKNPKLDVKAELAKITYDLVKAKVTALVNSPASPQPDPANPVDKKSRPPVIPPKETLDAHYLHQPNVDDLRLYGSSTDKPAKNAKEAQKNQRLELARRVIGELVASDNSDQEKVLAQQAMASGFVQGGVANAMLKAFKFINQRSPLIQADLQKIQATFGEFIHSKSSKYWPWYYYTVKDKSPSGSILDKLKNPVPGEVEANIAILHDVMQHFHDIAASTDAYSEEIKRLFASIKDVPAGSKKGTAPGLKTRGDIGDYRATDTSLLEFNEWVANARAFKLPVSAGPSMTTARMLEALGVIGASKASKKAMAWAIFGLWNTTYYRSTSGIHTFHEVMDIAKNYGIPYKPGKYPKSAP